MTGKAKEKLVVLAVSFALFALGIYAVYMDRGQTRTTMLAVAFAGLLVIAVWRTVQLRKKGK